MEKLDGKTMDIVSENIKKLKELFPEAFTEDKINFETLQIILGESIEKSGERYEFTWAGKTDAIKLSQQQSTGTLRPDKNSSKNWDTTKNLYIEGDNLEVLRLLQKSYHKKVKMIYIDPPYNTGNDFVYKDDFRDNVKNYKEKSNQAMKANPETSGRYHTDWLNMMYPRLRLAKNLLRDDGVIFISIDDNEVANLRKICDEIFGEENYVQEIIWEKKFSPQNDAKYFSLNHEQILCYAKQKEDFNRKLLPMTDEQVSRYKNLDNDPRGLWTSGDMSVTTYNKAYDYPITTPNGRVINPPNGRCWRTSKDKFEELLKENRIWFGEDGNNVPRIKRFLNETQQGRVPKSIWSYEEVGHTQSASQELKSLFDEKKYFDFPKPVNLVKMCMMLSTETDSIILDFFSGSATTAHAVMQLNAEDNGNRQFIMVQLPEPMDENSDAYKAGYKNICEIGKERIRRAGDKILKETGKTDLDIGFKVFTLDTSNIKAWDPDVEDIEKALLGMANPIKEDRTQEDVLYEIMLKYGVDLTMPIEEVILGGKKVYSVGLGYMLICLENEITQEVVEEMAKRKPSRAVFKDSGFKNDNIKTNAVQILKKYGIEDFRSI